MSDCLEGEALYKDVGQLYFDVFPQDGFTGGYDIPEFREKYGGKMFIPTKENVEKANSRVSELIKKTEDVTVLPHLGFLKVFLSIGEVEPDFYVDNLLYMLNQSMMIPDSEKYISEYIENAPLLFDALKEHGKVNQEVGCITSGLCKDLEDMLNNMKEIEKDDEFLFKEAIESSGVLEKIKEYREYIFPEAEKYKDHFSFIDDEPEKPVGTDRRFYYPRITNKIYGFWESNRGLLTSAKDIMEMELESAKEIIKDLVEMKDLDLDPSKLTIADAEELLLTKANEVDLIKTTEKRANALLEVIYEEAFEKIGEHNFSVEETPEYLRKSLPVAGVFGIGNLKNPRVRYVITPSGESKDVPIARYLQYDIHEYGTHAIHKSNAANSNEVEKDGKINWKNVLRMCNSWLAMRTAEGLGLYMEEEAVKLAPKIVEKLREHGLEETYGPLDEKIMEKELDLVRCKMKITRAARVVADIEGNMGFRSTREVIEETCTTLGLDKDSEKDRKEVYNYIESGFSCMPGYRLCYLFGYIPMIELREESDRRGISPKELNTEITRRGFPYFPQLKDEMEGWINKESSQNTD